MIRIKLKEALDDRNMNMMDLHRMTGIAQNSLSLFANQKTKGIQYDTLEKILTALNCNVEDIIEFVSPPLLIFVNLVEINKENIIVDLVIKWQEEVKGTLTKKKYIEEHEDISRVEFKTTYTIIDKNIYIHFILSKIKNEFQTKLLNNLFKRAVSEKKYPFLQHFYSYLIADRMMDQLDVVFDKKIPSDYEMFFLVSWEYIMPKSDTNYPTSFNVPFIKHDVLMDSLKKTKYFKSKFYINLGTAIEVVIPKD